MNKFESILNKSTEIQNYHHLDADEEWNAFMDLIEQKHPEENLVQLSPNTKKPPAIYYFINAIAATFLIVLLFVFILKPKESNRIQYQASNNGETIHLADGSTITLAKNAIINYPKNYENQNARFVTLQGEGTFDVTRSILPFIVHYDSIEIRVLGTKFFLSKSNDTLIVKNLEGSVRVAAIGNPDNYTILQTDDALKFVKGNFIGKEVSKPTSTLLSEEEKVSVEETHSDKNNKTSIDLNLSTYNLGDVLKEFLVKQNKKTIKIDKHFKYNPDVKVRLNLQKSASEVINDLKNSGLINTEKGKCPECIIITAPDNQK